MEQGRLFTQDEARQVRKVVALIGVKALQVLRDELEQERRGGISEAWTKKFKILADQIRRDYRLEGEGVAAEPAEPAVEADPLGGLRVVSEEEEVA